MDVLTMIDDKGQEYEVKPERYDDAKAQGLKTIFSFRDEQGQDIAVPEDKLDAAFEKGLKPKDHKEMSYWESFKKGFGKGFRSYPEIGTAWNKEEPETPLQEAQAYAEDPNTYRLGYGVGALAPAIGMAFSGGLAYKGGKKVVAPRITAARVAAQEAGRGALESAKNVELGLGVDMFAKPTAAIVGGIKAARETYPHALTETKNLEALKAQMATTGEGGYASNRVKPSFPLTDVLVKPGYEDIKAQIAERAATILPQNISKEPLEKILKMDAERRQTARGFIPQTAAEEITPQLKEMLKNLESKKSGVFSKLQGEARSQYTPDIGQKIPELIKQQREKVKGIKGLSSTVVGTLSQVNQIVNKGPEVFNLKPGKFNEVSPQDQFDRLQTAREVLDGRLRVMARSNDPAINDRTSMRLLQEMRDNIDSSLKSLPAKQQADELYAAGTQARKQFFDKMEFGKGRARDIDAATVERLFGNNAQAKRQQAGIEYMRVYLDKYGDKIAPEQKQSMQKTVDRFDELRRIAEDKRLIEGVRQQPGPTSPVIQATESLRASAGLPSDIYTAPSGALKSIDEFFTSRARSEFGKSIKDLTQDEFNMLSKMYNWRTKNPKANPDRENEVFKQFRKGK